MGFSEEREPEWDSEGESSDEEFWGVPRFRLSPGLGPQVIRRRPMPPVSPPLGPMVAPPPVEGPGQSSEEIDEFVGVSKDQIMRIIREAQDLGVPMDLPRQYNKMSREHLLEVVRETYGDEMDQVIRESRTRPGARVRLSSRAIQNAFKDIAERMSSYRRGGTVRNRGREVF